MEQSTPPIRKVKCPQCGHLAVYSSENQWRPFCSQRCRLLDLGQWADGNYRIPIPGSDPEIPADEVADDDRDENSD